MNPLVPVVLFGVTAVGGATLATFHFRKGWAPALVAYGHGGLAVTGLGTLTAAVHEGTATGLAQWALAVLSLAVLAGATFLVGFRLRARPIPRPFIVIHGLVAVRRRLLRRRVREQLPAHLPADRPGHPRRGGGRVLIPEDLLRKA